MLLLLPATAINSDGKEEERRSPSSPKTTSRAGWAKRGGEGGRTDCTMDRQTDRMS